MGLGQCHWVGGVGLGHSSWAYSGDNTYGWGYIEPERGKFNWSPYLRDIQLARERGKKIWLQILTSAALPYTIPQWAKEEGIEILGETFDSKMAGPFAACWDPKYRKLFGEALEALAREFEQDKYSYVVEAIIIAACGGYGEMTIQARRNCYGLPNSDVTDINDPYVKSLAKAYGRTPKEMTERNCNCAGTSCLCFDYYYIKSVIKMIDLYMRYFKKLPVVLQLGTSISCQAIVPAVVANYAHCRYGERVWVKFNGWSPVRQGALLSGNSNFTHTGFEPAHPYNFTKTYWRDDRNNNNIRDCLEDSDGDKTCNHPCPKEKNPAECVNYGRDVVNNYVNNTIYKSGNSIQCLQSVFFENPSEHYFTIGDCGSQGFCSVSLDRFLKNNAARPKVTPSVDQCKNVLASFAEEGDEDIEREPTPTPPIIRLIAGWNKISFSLSKEIPLINTFVSLKNNNYWQPDIVSNLLNTIAEKVYYILNKSSVPLSSSNPSPIPTNTPLPTLAESLGCKKKGGVCCSGNYGSCQQRLIDPWNEDITSGGCNPEASQNNSLWNKSWCCQKCN